MSKTNGKTHTHFEQIALAIVERIAITDVPDTRDGDGRVSDIPEEPPAPYQIRRAVDRRKSWTTTPSPPGKES